MEKIIAKFKLVSPAFLAGADQAKAELRVPSIKGVLRFWWRALEYAKSGGDIETIREKESHIFGDAGKIGSSSFQMRVQSFQGLSTKDEGYVHPDFKKMPGARYLGYGVMEAFDGKNTTAGRLTRGCLQPGEFELDFVSKNGFDETFLDAVKLLGLLGGIGSRSRKGYGSVTLLELISEGKPPWSRPDDVKSYQKAMANILGKTGDGLPEFTAFSSKANVRLVAKEKSPLELVNMVGDSLQRYRSWGKDGKVNGQPAERKFVFDHDEMLKATAGTKPLGHPKRVVFGLPHNYYFSSTRGKGDVTAEYENRKKIERRASPLFIHIHEFKEGSYGALVSILPARFLPEGGKLKVCSWDFKAEPDWSVLSMFADRFPDGVRIWPN